MSECIKWERVALQYVMETYLNTLGNSSQYLRTSKQYRNPFLLVPSTGLQVATHLPDTNDVRAQAPLFAHTQKESFADPLAFAVARHGSDLGLGDGFLGDGISRIT